MLTADIVTGIILARLVMRLNIPAVISRYLPVSPLPPSTTAALSMSLVSPKAGAAIIADSYNHGTISSSAAALSILALPFPPFLTRRFIPLVTFASSSASLAGLMFSLSLLTRSAVRFLLTLSILRHRSSSTSPASSFILPAKISSPPLIREILRSLPHAWLMSALTYLLLPPLERWTASYFTGNFLPLSGWTAAVSSIGSTRSALILAGSSMRTGALSVTQAYFALILGSGLGTVIRIFRQDAGYYFGLFPPSFAAKLLIMNAAAIIPLVGVNLIFAGLALSLWP